MPHSTWIDMLRAGLVRYRAERKLSQEDVARELGVSRSTVANFELGRTFLREEAFVKVVRLVASPSALLADQLRGLLDTLNSPLISESVKIEHFFHALTELQAAAKRFRVDLDKRTKGRQ